MKLRATGIVRSVDDLNRIVIPRTMSAIKQFEFLAGEDGDIVLRPAIWVDGQKKGEPRLVRMTSEGLPDQFIRTTLTNDDLVSEKCHQDELIHAYEECEELDGDPVYSVEYDFVEFLVMQGLAEVVDFDNDTFNMDDQE